MRDLNELKRIVNGYDASLSIRENAKKLKCSTINVEIAQSIIMYLNDKNSAEGCRDSVATVSLQCTKANNDVGIFKPYFNKINDFCLGKIDKSAEELFGDYYNDWDSFDEDIKDTICNQCNITLEELRNYFEYVTML